MSVCYHLKDRIKKCTTTTPLLPKKVESLNRNKMTNKIKFGSLEAAAKTAEHCFPGCITIMPQIITTTTTTTTSSRWCRLEIISWCV